MGAAEGEKSRNALTVLAICIACLPLDGFAVKSLWWWFVVPLGVRPVGIVHGAALVFVGRYLTGSRGGTKTPTISDTVSAMVWWPLIALAIGWALKSVGI